MYVDCCCTISFVMQLAIFCTYFRPFAYNILAASVLNLLNYCSCYRSMSMRTLSMLGSRVSTPRYGTLNSNRDFHTGMAAESRTLDRLNSSTFDRSLHTDRSRNGFERSTSLQPSRPQNFGRIINGEGRSTPVTSPVSFQTFYTQQQQQQQQPQQLSVHNGGTRDLYPPRQNVPATLGYFDMSHRGKDIGHVFVFWLMYIGKWHVASLFYL